MKARLSIAFAASVAALLVAATGAFASGGNGGGGADRCASFPAHAVSVGPAAGSVPDVSVGFTVTNCSQSKPELIDVDLALEDLAGHTIWVSGTGYTQWLAPGQSLSGTFAGLGLLGMSFGQTYDMQFVARDFTKLDVLATADDVFSTPAG
jgi:hypothetical protein